MVVAGAVFAALSAGAAAQAASFTITFDNLNFSGGEVVNGSFTYDDDPTCCNALTGSITGTGGVFAGETIVWEPGDVLTFDNNDEGTSVFGVNKNTGLFNNASFFFISDIDQLTTLGDVPVPFSQVNRDGVLPSNFVSGTVTISQESTEPEPVPEPASMLGLLAVGAIGAGSTLKLKHA